MKPQTTSCRTQDGFTLVELLVVISIIAVLLALLAPAMDKAINVSEKAVCGTRINQIGAGNFQYAMDHKRRLVPVSSNQVDAAGRDSAGVANFADPVVHPTYPNYLGSISPRFGTRDVFVCPTVRKIPWPGQTPTAYSHTNYMGNGAVFGLNLTRLDRTSGTIMVQELQKSTHIAWFRPASFANNGIYSYWHWDGNFTIPEAYNTAHDQDGAAGPGNDGGGGGNLLYADGHVEYHPLAELTAGDFALTSGTGVTGKATDTHESADTLSYRSRLRP